MENPLQKLFRLKFCLLTILLLTLIACTHLTAQPYVDPVQVRYMYALRKNNSAATPFIHLWVGNDVPVKIKVKENAYILLSPYYEFWNLDSAESNSQYPVVQSLTLPVGAIIPIGKSKWTVNLIPMIRTNGEVLFADKTFQYAIVSFASFARKPNQKFRFGLYASKEFFGWFVIPTVGCDWKIDDKNYLFGLLPGRLTYEHKLNNKLFWGSTFRAPMNSYRFTNGQYIRLDDQQLSAYLDYYPLKNICIAFEPGYGIMRKIRTGINDDKNYLAEVKWGDGPFIKLCLSYRIRL